MRHAGLLSRARRRQAAIVAPGVPGAFFGAGYFGRSYFGGAFFG